MHNMDKYTSVQLTAFKQYQCLPSFHKNIQRASTLLYSTELWEIFKCKCPSHHHDVVHMFWNTFSADGIELNEPFVQMSPCVFRTSRFLSLPNFVIFPVAMQKFKIGLDSFLIIDNKMFMKITNLLFHINLQKFSVLAFEI